MELYVDSADLDEIKEIMNLGILRGVTTNPTLIKKSAEKRKKPGNTLDLDSYITTILRTVGKGIPVSLEVIGTTESDMYREAKLLYEKFNKIADNVVIKIPINPSTYIDRASTDGLKVIKRLTAEGIPVNCTLIMTPQQALLAANAGATYVSPFAGRIDDFLRDKYGISYNKGDYYPKDGLGTPAVNDNGIVSGVDLVEKTVKLLRGYSTKVIAASLRNPKQVLEVAYAGADIGTVPYSTIKDLLSGWLSHHKTAEGMRKFIDCLLYTSPSPRD